MKPILEIQNISKRFIINHELQPYLSIRDSIANIFKNKSSKEDFWALKDVSFDVMPGDTVGIIGKNGAGKSTLLKILSKITPPSNGKIISRGRIASLLEVGTGFHPELSGRENVFMNGSILGMRRGEIIKNFDAIVDFAGVEKFIDMPLKHYSSGMQLRLAFAVAAFLENEILIIDEVLAVGDAEFQKKCMGKMEDVSKSGRTILFVSHNMNSIAELCKYGILLNSGKMYNGIDHINRTIDRYLMMAEINTSYIVDQKVLANGKGIKQVILQNIKVINKQINSGETLTFELLLENKEKLVASNNFEIVIGIWDSSERDVAMMSTRYNDYKILSKFETTKLMCVIPKLCLNSGNFSVNVLIKVNGIDSHFLEKVLLFKVEQNDYYKTVQKYPYEYKGVYFDNYWKIE